MGKQWKRWRTFSWAPKSLQMVDCSHEIKRHLLLGRKAMTNLARILKGRDKGQFANKGPSSQIYGSCSSHVWMWKLDYKESWAPKNAECRRIDAFELWCWRRLLRVPWTPKRSNLSILKEISPKYSLEGLTPEADDIILWPPDVMSWLNWKRPWCWERLKAKEGRRRRQQQRMRWLGGITDSVDMSLSKL